MAQKETKRRAAANLRKIKVEGKVAMKVNKKNPPRSRKAAVTQARH